MRRRLVVVLLAMIALIASGANAASTTTIRWHGHAAFEIGTPNGAVILIDPWLTNPANPAVDRKSTRLNSSHLVISYAVFCLKKKKKNRCTSKSCCLTHKRHDH